MPKQRGIGVAVTEPISPELALVCPELRRRALELLPDLDPDALFVVEPAPARERSPLPLALAAYTTEALLVGALRAAAVTAVIAGTAFFLSW